MGSTDATSWKKPWQSPLVQHMLRLALVLVVIALLFEAFLRLNVYGEKVVKRKVVLLPVRIQLLDTPSWLDKAILDRVLQITGELANKDKATFAAFQDPGNSQMLREIAERYTSLPEKKPDGSYEREYAAWIDRIKFVRRVTDTVRREERIEIAAEYRKPAGVIVLGDNYYLVDKNLVRLPGVYHESDVKQMTSLMVISHVDEELPDVGAAWKSAEARAGLQLAQLLAGQTFAPQIAAINVSNYGGRVDKMGPQIVLDTESGSSVWWGRPVGTESYYEINAAAKIKALQSVFMRYGRVDASRQYVDIRFEQVKVPVPTERAAGETGDTGAVHG